MDADAVGRCRNHLQLSVVATALKDRRAVTTRVVIRNVDNSKQFFGLPVKRHLIIQILLGNEVVVDDKIFNRVTIWGTKAFGKKVLCVQILGNAGKSYYYIENLAKIREYLEKNLPNEE